MSLIKVFTELDNGVTTSLPAKIISQKGDVFTITYLSPTDQKDSHNRRIYKYEFETYEITDESITDYIDSDMEIDFGFKQISEHEFVKYDTDSDDDYVPSESGDESSSEEDEEEEFTDEEEVYDDESD